MEPSSDRKWYTAEDCERFEKERTSDVVAIRLEQSRQKGPPKKRITKTFEESICPVGVEQVLSDEGMKEKLSYRKNVIKGVLIEQTRQRDSFRASSKHPADRCSFRAWN